MSPFFLIPAGLFVTVAITEIESAMETSSGFAHNPTDEMILLDTFISSTQPEIPSGTKGNSPTLVSTTSIYDPPVTSKMDKTIKKQPKQSEIQLLQKSVKNRDDKPFDDNPGRHFPDTQGAKDKAYSAPQGVRDEAQVDWMK